MEITYIGACLDSSGYAEAARNNIAALNAVGVKQKVVPISFEAKKTNMGKLGDLIDSLIGDDRKTKIRILHATPPNYRNLVRKAHYNIGYAAWEASRLPDEWIPMINLLDEVWVPSQHNKEVFEKSIDIPVYVIPHTFDVNEVENLEQSEPIVKGRDGEFYFYSIFQWLERKNPIGLLRAFLTEFKTDEHVTLVMKTFRQHPGRPEDAQSVTKGIQAIKHNLYLPEYPRLLLISSLMTRDQILSLHKQCDCYVSLNRCEGFGIPLTEAMLAGKPVIATQYGGAEDFLNKDNGWPIDYQMTPVAGMPWPMYKGYMEWAEPDLMQARRAMRFIFENREEAAEKGQRAKAWVKENLNWQTVGRLMKERLESING